MTSIFLRAASHWAQRLAFGVAMLTLTACSALRPPAPQPTAFYSLDRQSSQSVPPTQGMAAQSLLTLIVNPPQAVSGFDSQRIMYVREDHKLEYFAHSEWVDPPARMLGPLLVAAIDKVGAFGTVVLTPASVSGELRLDTQILRLQQNFQTSPSRVQFTLRAYLTDEKTRVVLAWREFSAEATASSDNAQGGVNAANRVVQDVLALLAQFLATTSR
ncbi:MAG TPA: ABC-type transport auxiliary lipoprotein family protein [Rhodoferax sp.]